MFRLFCYFLILAAHYVEDSPISVTTYILAKISKYVVKLAIITYCCIAITSHNLRTLLDFYRIMCLQVCNSSYEVFILLVNGVLWCSTVHGFLPAATESYYIQAKMLQKKTLAYDPKRSQLVDWHAGIIGRHRQHQQSIIKRKTSPLKAKPLTKLMPQTFRRCL